MKVTKKQILKTTEFKRLNTLLRKSKWKLKELKKGMEIVKPLRDLYFRINVDDFFALNQMALDFSDFKINCISLLMENASYCGSPAENAAKILKLSIDSVWSWNMGVDYGEVPSAQAMSNVNFEFALHKKALETLILRDSALVQADGENQDCRMDKMMQVRLDELVAYYHYAIEYQNIKISILTMLAADTIVILDKTFTGDEDEFDAIKLILSNLIQHTETELLYVLLNVRHYFLNKQSLKNKKKSKKIYDTYLASKWLAT